jgi:hypothetical protein
MGITPRFALGALVSTPGALDALDRNNVSCFAYVARHASGDWGELSAHDRRANETAIQTDPELYARILSAYHLADGTKIWIITEADRSSTCILLPSEY